MRDILVSIVVVAYNAEQTIIGTLESIKDQTYKNIELIISDDCSTDNTVRISQEWVEKNKERFTNALVVKTKRNRGVTSNAMNGIDNTKGPLIKVFGSDDLMLKEGIADCVEYYEETGFEVFFSKYVLIGNEEIIQENRLVDHYEKIYNILRETDQVKKRDELFINIGMPTVTMCFTRELYDRLGGYNPAYPFWEDGPFYYKLLDKKVDIGFLDKSTVQYLVREGSLSHSWNRGGKISYAGFMNLRDYVRGFFKLRLLKLIFKQNIKGVLTEIYIMIKPTLIFLFYRINPVGIGYIKRYKELFKS